jgi:hypothetical protein
VKGTFIVFILLLFNILSSAYGQQVSGEFKLSGNVMDSLSKAPVAFCHIYNESTRKGTVSDSLGNFSTYVTVGDTLAFLALGYFGKIKIIKSLNEPISEIFLNQKIYEIEDVTIGNSFPQTYPEFKKKFLALELKKNTLLPDIPKFDKYKTPMLLDTNVINSAGFMIMHPVSGLYYRFSKEEQSKRMVMYLKEQELKQPAVDAKYNRNIVSEITGLTGDDLTNFMGYCNFNFWVLYKAAPYEIAEMITRKFNLYKNCCYHPAETKNQVIPQKE